jgi:uncharacterized membrane protein
VNLWIGIALILGAMIVGGVLISLISRKSPEGSLADRIPTSVNAVTAGAMTLLAVYTFPLHSLNKYQLAEHLKRLGRD